MSALASSFYGAALKEPSKTIHALKMALALVLAFMLVLLQVPYEKLGSHAIWAIMTVIVVFEFTIGATFSKGMNRGAGTLLSGLLAIAVGQLAGMSEGVGHPLMIGLSAFIIGGVVTFAKLWPPMKSYEVGFRTFLITFSLIMAAEYTGGDPLNTALQRFLVILLGAAIGIVVNVFVLPCWAGEDLHRCIVNNFYGVADSLEVCVNEYLKGTILEKVPSKIFMGLAADDPVYKGYRSTLVSASKEESLAGFASWEPPHGRFKMMKYPWHLYVKIGAVLRHCAYSVVALHGCLHSAIQAPVEVRKIFENELREVSVEGALVLRKLGRQVEDMHKGDPITTLQGVQHAVDQLQQSLYFHSYLLVQQEIGILEESVENIAVSVITEITRPDDDEKSGNLTRLQSANKLWIHAHAYEETTDLPGRCVNTLHCWPLRSMDGFDFAKETFFEQRVKVLESAGALSLGTFATLLMEVALRLDYVVEAVEELAEVAKFAVGKGNMDTDIKVQINGFHPQITIGTRRILT